MKKVLEYVGDAEGHEPHRRRRPALSLFALVGGVVHVPGRATWRSSGVRSTSSIGRASSPAAVLVVLSPLLGQVPALVALAVVAFVTGGTSHLRDDSSRRAAKNRSGTSGTSTPERYFVAATQMARFSVRTRPALVTSGSHASVTLRHTRSWTSAGCPFVRFAIGGATSRVHPGDSSGEPAS